MKPTDLKVILPVSIDITNDNRIRRKSDLGEEGYFPNTQYDLVINLSLSSFTGDTVNISIDYYGEDDTYLSNLLDLKGKEIHCTEETFEDTQKELAKKMGLNLDAKNIFTGKKLKMNRIYYSII